MSIGLTLATKFYLWPLVIWFAATRRLVAAALAVVVGAGLLVASWAVIGFVGFTSYPSVLRQLEGVVGQDSYTLYECVGDTMTFHNPEQEFQARLQRR